MRLAELLATAGNIPYQRPEAKAAPRPTPPSAEAKAAALGVAGDGVAVIVGAVGALVAGAMRKRR
jgi:hypothetical protein